MCTSGGNTPTTSGLQLPTAVRRSQTITRTSPNRYHNNHDYYYYGRDRRIIRPRGRAGFHIRAVHTDLLSAGDVRQSRSIYYFVLKNYYHL